MNSEGTWQCTEDTSKKTDFKIELNHKCIRTETKELLLPSVLPQRLSWKQLWFVSVKKRNSPISTIPYRRLPIIVKLIFNVHW